MEINNEQLKECANALKEYCKEHKHNTSYRTCDCPFVQAYNCGYLCGLYGYPFGYNVDREETKDV